MEEKEKDELISAFEKMAACIGALHGALGIEPAKPPTLLEQIQEKYEQLAQAKYARAMKEAEKEYQEILNKMTKELESEVAALQKESEARPDSSNDD